MGSQRVGHNWATLTFCGIKCSHSAVHSSPPSSPELFPSCKTETSHPLNKNSLPHTPQQPASYPNPLWFGPPRVWDQTVLVSGSLADLTQVCHAEACVPVSLLPRLNNAPLCLDYILLLHPLVHTKWTLGMLPRLAIVNHAIMTKRVQVSLWVPQSFWPFPRSGMAASYVNSIFNFLRTHHAIFYTRCTILHSHQQHTHVPISPYPILVTLAILMGMRWYLTVVFT